VKAIFKRILYLWKILSFLLISICYANLIEEITLTNDLAKDIGRAYGFYLGQDLSLDKILELYPALSSEVIRARYEFSSNYKSSIEYFDVIMNNYSATEWNEIKNGLHETLKQMMQNNYFTETEARQFINVVRQRAKGNIDSPVLETFLLFNPKYQQYPEKEFLDGFRNKYESSASGKSQGIRFSIEYPKTWKSEDGNRPHIVQKFVSGRGKGFSIFMIGIHELSLPTGVMITESDVDEILNPSDLKELLPAGAEIMNYGKLTLEGFPGYWVNYKITRARAKNYVTTESASYFIYYKDKLIEFDGSAAVSVDNIKIDGGGLNKYEKLFDLMINSFVLYNKY